MRDGIRGLTPAQLADWDQRLAAVDLSLDRALELMRRQLADGMTPNEVMAAAVVGLTTELDQESALSLAVVAMARLAVKP